MKFKFIRNPELESIHPQYPGNRFLNGVYYNDKDRHQPGAKEMLRMLREGNPQKKEKKEDNFRVKTVLDLSFLTNKKDCIVWLGHAAFFLRLGNVKLLFDPCLSSLPFMKRMVETPFGPEALPELDMVLFSHGHRDHFDKPSVRRIIKMHPEARYLVPLGLSRLLKPLNLMNYQEAGWYQRFTGTKGLEIIFCPAIHWNRRFLNDFNNMLWGSFYINWENEEGNRRSLFIAGDTAYGPHFKEISSLLGSADTVLMPVGAYKPRFMMKTSHVNPTEAINAFHELKGKHFIPMHYATYDLSQEPPGEPVRELHNAVKNETLKGKLSIPDAGEIVWL